MSDSLELSRIRGLTKGGLAASEYIALFARAVVRGKPDEKK